MQKSILLTISLLTLTGASLIFSSCSKDDEKPTPPKLSFFDEDMTVNEDDGTIEVRIVLDKPFSKPIAIDYDVEGTAVEGSSASSDYEINGSFGEVVIEAGETEAFIEIEIKNDGLYEGDETIEFTIDEVNSEDIEITNEDKVTITIQDNDEQPKLSVVSTALTVNESIGLVQIEVQLDNPSSQDITFQYTVSGTARDSVTAVNANPVLPADYAIRDDQPGEGIIEAGSTTGVINLFVYSDFFYEITQTAIITLTGASGDAEILNSAKITTVNIQQQDGTGIQLEWSGTDVDMDMFVWIGEDLDNLEDEPIASSITPSVTPPEIIFIPDVIQNAAFGLSYTYWGGTSNAVNLDVYFVDIVDGIVEPEANWTLYEATYTLANINEWDNETTGTDLVIAQTFEKVAGEVVNISQITVPTTGSRVKGKKLPATLKRASYDPFTLTNF